MRFARPNRTGAPLALRAAHDGGSAASAELVVDATPRTDAVVPDSHTLEPRLRTGRLPLPRRVADLTPADQPTLALVNAFADSLAELPMQAWLAIGRRLMADTATAPQRLAAFTALEEAIGAYGLGVAAWYARDAVETSAFLASGCLPHWTSAERRLFAATQAAAENAALALLARGRLTPAHFTILTKPLEHLLPR